MLILISPAKTLDFDAAALTDGYTEPDLLDRASELVAVMQKLSASQLSKLMGLSDHLAQLNARRYQDWRQPFNLHNAKQAVYAFKGEVYQGLQVETLGHSELAYLQHHVRILSGLYGLLRPLDLIQPYRLEMGTKLVNPKGPNLYAFWGGLLTEKLNQSLLDDSTPVLVNLASQEYFKVLQPRDLKAQIVTPIFQDWHNGTYKIISFYAKRARGLMARYAVDRQITEVHQLQGFDYEGYRYSPEHSSEQQWVFLRNQVSR